MHELKRLIAAGRVKVVLIYKLERVLRSTAEWGPFRSFLQQHHCLLESATEDLSENTPSGRFKNNILISAAEYERENTAEKTRVKMREQAKRGYWNGGMVPFGYDYDEKSQSLNPHPTESVLVRRMFEQTARLVSLTDVANSLNAEGHRTKSRVWTRRDGAKMDVGGNRFRADGIRLILANPIYRGAIRFAGEEYPGKHEGLVPDDMWERANSVITKTPREERPALILEKDKHGHLLKGLVYCGHCRRALIPHDSGKRAADHKPYRYYDCGQVARKSRDAICPVGRIPAGPLESAVVAFLTQLGRHRDVVHAALSESHSKRAIDRAPLSAALQETEQAYSETKRQIRNCVDAIAAGGADLLSDELKERVAALHERRQELVVTLERQHQDLRACDEKMIAEKVVVDAIDKLSETLRELSHEEQKELLVLFINRIEVHPSPDRTQGRRQLELRYKIGLPKLIASMQERVVARGPANDHPLPTRQTMVLTSTVRLGPQTIDGSSAILSPFQHLVRTRRTPKAQSIPARHAIHRAIAWRDELRQDPTMQKQLIALREKLTPGAITHHLKLLTLTPTIQQFLQDLTDPAAVHYFSLRKMRRLANLPVPEQKSTFAELRRTYNGGIAAS